MSSAAEKLTSDFGVLARSGSMNPATVLAIVDLIGKDLQSKKAPEAYLMYALYDADSNLYEKGKKVLTKKAANQHEVLEENLYISQAGYMEAFVVNETNEDVWFDDFSVMTTTPHVVQETHYDPWGLELFGIGFQYAGIKVNKFLYQGKELIEDNTLNLYDFHARGYDPAIGRTFQMDPHAENYLSFSPYSWVLNNPISHIDPDGKDVYVIINGVARLAKKEEGDATFIDDNTGKKIDPFGKDWSFVASALNEAGLEVINGLGDSDNSKALRKQIGLYNSMQIKNTFNDNVDLVTGIAGLRSLLKNGITWWAKHFGDDVATNILPNSGPIVKSLGAASKAEMLAKKLKMNINSPTTRQVLNSLDETVDSFIATYRRSSIRSEIPGEFLGQTVEQALKSGNTTIRKLLTDGRFVK